MQRAKELNSSGVLGFSLKNLPIKVLGTQERKEEWSMHSGADLCMLVASQHGGGSGNPL